MTDRGNGGGFFWNERGERMPAEHPEGCRNCPLDELGVGFAKPEGTGAVPVLIVGESLGSSEAKDSLPFRPYAESGSVLEKAFQRAGYRRQQFALFNVVNCQPPYNKLAGESYEIGAINHCRPNLDEVIKRFQPKCILALGAIAMRTLTGLAGPKLSISHVRGFVLHSPQYDLPVVAAIHPSFIRRLGMKMVEVLTYDLELAVRVARGKVKLEPIEECNYAWDPEPKDLEYWFDAAKELSHYPIAYDIETDFSRKTPDESEIEIGGNITQIQFSIGPKSALVLPWNPRTRILSQRVLDLPNDKWSWNGDLFDRKVLEAHGLHINGRHIDLMDAWHQLQPDLPRGLQFVTSFYSPELGPWKHLSGTDAFLYGGRDVDSLYRIGQRLFTDLGKRGVARSYWEHTFKLRPILDKMCERGLPVDGEEQQKLKHRLEREMEEIYREIQPLVPSTLIKYKKISGGRDYYVGVPPALKALLHELGPTSEEEVARVALERLGMVKRMVEGELRWCLKEGFNPNSSLQMKEYARLKGYRIPLAEREGGEETESSSEKVVSDWAKRYDDEVCRQVIEYKKRQKVISTYIEGFRPDANGRIHSTFTFIGATGQLSSRDPNIQNYPKNGDLAKAVRKLVKAKEGHQIIEFDMRGFHAKTLGWLAKSPDYMRLSDLGIHSFLAAHMLRATIAAERGKKKITKERLEELEGWEKDIEGLDGWLQLPDIELKARLDLIKKNHKFLRDKKAKPACHGIGFHMGAKKLYTLNQESFENIADALGVINLMRRLFPGVFSWQEEIIEKAHRQSYLLSPHGTIRRFYEVKRWDPKYGQWRGGAGAEEAVAFLPATCAFGEIKDRMLALEEMGLLEKYNLVNYIHDSLVFECPNELVEECIPLVKGLMESASNIMVDKEMGAFWCGVDVQMGEDWGSLREVTT